MAYSCAVATQGVVVIGNFDGVHLGHRAVLKRAKQCSSGPLTVVTFWPHPLSIVAPERTPKLLADLRTRIELLKDAGADEVRVVSFTSEVAALSPAEFVSKVIDPLRPGQVVVGDNFRFGRRAAGDVDTLRELGAGRFEVIGLDLLQVERSVTCSTLIRDALAAGNVALAARHLGRNFRVRGVVVLGDQRGRQLGFPTANMMIGSDLALPADAVYAGYLTRLDQPDAEPAPAAISVGLNPTFDGRDHRVETHVIGRDDLELYGVEVAVDFVARLRGQIKYSGIAPLIEQMKADVAQARSLVGVR